MKKKTRLPVIEAKPLTPLDVAMLAKAGKGSGVLDPTRTATDPGVFDRLQRQFMGGFAQDLQRDLNPYTQDPASLAMLFAKGPGKAPGGVPSWKERYDDLVEQHALAFQRLADIKRVEQNTHVPVGGEVTPLFFQRLRLERELQALQDELIALHDAARKAGVRRLTTPGATHRKPGPTPTRRTDPLLQALTNQAYEGNLPR